MKRKILLVEDNPDDELLTCRAMEKSGFEVEVTVARDGREALAYLLGQGEFIGRNKEDTIHLVFLDLKLPLLSGLEVLEKLKADTETRTIPVVVLTSSKEEDDIIRSYNLGANSYVRKRVNAQEFQEALKDILTYWFNFAQLPRKS